jgi:hypothetical protein
MIANFILNRILQDSASFGAPYAEGLIAPIEIAQLKACDFAASEPVNRKQQKNGFGAKVAR